MFQMRNHSRFCKTPDDLRLTTREEIEEAARSAPDARPLTPDELKRMRRSPQVKIIRRALGLTQEEFAARYHIPIGLYHGDCPRSGRGATRAIIVLPADILRHAFSRLGRVLLPLSAQ